MNLNQIRQQIKKLEAERLAVAAAIPPASDLEAQLRTHLDLLAIPGHEFIDACGTALNGGGFSDLLPFTPAGLSRAAFSLNLTSARIDTIVEAAKRKAAKEDNGALRLDDTERTERLAAIAADLYVLQLTEEAALGGNTRRADVNAAAVINIPLDAAIEFGLV